MDYLKIEKFNILTIAFGTLILFFFSYSYALGFLLGGLASLLSFRYLQKLEYVSLDNLSLLKRTIRKNKLVRYCIYALALIIAFLNPNTFNYLTCFLGIIVIKIWIMLVGGVNYD